MAYSFRNTSHDGDISNTSSSRQVHVPRSAHIVSEMRDTSICYTIMCVNTAWHTMNTSSICSECNVCNERTPCGVGVVHHTSRASGIGNVRVRLHCHRRRNCSRAMRTAPVHNPRTVIGIDVRITTAARMMYGWNGCYQL